MLLKSIATLSGLTLLSRVFGFVRDILTASILGAGPVADAFFVAFQLPNFFRSLFAEGAFSASFVPLFSRILTQQDREKALTFASQTLSLMVVILVGFVAVVEIFMPHLIWVIAPGFTDDAAQHQMVIEFARLTFPYLFFISLVALFGGVQNSLHQFSFFASAPILLNLTLIGSLLFITPYVENAGYAMALGVLMTGVVQLAWMVLGNRRAKARFVLAKPTLSPEVKKLARLIGPGALGASVTQLNLLVGTVLATFLPMGSVSYLYFANRVAQLPLGIIGVAIGTALLPLLTQHIRGNKKREATDALNRGIEIGLLLTLPAAAAMLVMPLPLVTVLFEHGKFEAADSLAAAAALMAYGAGVPAYVLIKVLSPGFFAREDTKTPVKIAVGCVALNIGLNIVLMQFFGHVGIAASTAICAWINAGLLAFVLRRRNQLEIDATLQKRGPRIIFSTALMAAVTWWAAVTFFDTTAPLQAQILVLAGLILAGKIVFFSVAVLTGGMEPALFKKILLKKTEVEKGLEKGLEKEAGKIDPPLS